MKATVQDAINGADNLSDTRQPYGALQQFYRALNTLDRELMARNWDSSEDAAMDNPLGGIKRGWDEIASVYDACSQPMPNSTLSSTTIHCT